MKKNSTFILVIGVTILCIFAGVSAKNLLPNNTKSNSYYTKTENEMNAKIKDIEVKDNIMYVTTENNPQMICVKTTKSTPTDDNICWQKIENNNYNIKIISGKKYYIWIKDIDNNISSPEIMNT